MKPSAITVRKQIKPILFLMFLLPLLWLVYGWSLYVMGDLSVVTANPIEYSNRHLGDWALRCLLVALAVRPLSRLGDLVWVMQLRRIVGLFAFFYAPKLHEPAPILLIK